MLLPASLVDAVANGRELARHCRQYRHGCRWFLCTPLRHAHFLQSLCGMSLKKLNTSPGATSFRSQGTKPILPRRLAGEKCIAVEEGAITEVLRLRGGRRSPVRESAERRTTSSKCACGRRTARPRLARRPAPTPRQSFPGGAGRSCVYLTLGCLPAPSRSREKIGRAHV